MKKVWILLFLAFSAQAQDKDPDCIDIQSFPYKIVQQLDRHHYGMVIVMGGTGRRFILETKKAVFSSPGAPVGIGVKSAGMREVKLVSGFTTRIEVIKECSIIPYKSDVLFGPGLSFRERIGGK